MALSVASTIMPRCIYVPHPNECKSLGVLLELSHACLGLGCLVVFEIMTTCFKNNFFFLKSIPHYVHFVTLS